MGRTRSSSRRSRDIQVISDDDEIQEEIQVLPHKTRRQTRQDDFREDSVSTLSSLSSMSSITTFQFTRRVTRADSQTNEIEVPSAHDVYVEIPPLTADFDRDAYTKDEEEFNAVGIVGEIGEGDDISYEVQFEDTHLATMPLSKLLSYPNGDVVLQEYEKQSRGRKRLRSRKVNLPAGDKEGSDDELFFLSSPDNPRKRRHRNLVRPAQERAHKNVRQLRHKKQTRSQTSGNLVALPADYREDEDEIGVSDAPSAIVGTRRSTRQQKPVTTLRYDLSDRSDDDYESEGEERSKQSSRSSSKPKVKKAVEVFAQVDEDSLFAERHQYWCITDFAALGHDGRDIALCQGCSYVYHVECLGDKAARLKRGHNIIMLDERDGEKLCVLQCGRCAGGGRLRTLTTRCFVCGQIGDRCQEFDHPVKETELSEERDVREEQLLKGWNDPTELFFRCLTCARACHFHHLPPPPIKEPSHFVHDVIEVAETMDLDGPTDTVQEETPALTADEIFDFYSSNNWRCNECREYNDKRVEIVLGWRHTENKDLSEDAPNDFCREYLVKFDKESYARATWVPALWLAGITFQMKSNFDKQKPPSINSPEDVIQEAWLRVDIVFDVRYDDKLTRERMKFRSESDELEALPRVTKALCKWQKLKYEEVTWEIPPSEDSPRFEDFKSAYEEYVHGNWIHLPNYRGKNDPYADLAKSEDVIQAEFGHRLEMKQQPEWVKGGDMFEYQLEGMNWLYFQWFKQTSAILADEMGLGKTIQIIATISTIFTRHRRWPFLVIAPNSTIENWRREFRKWAPSLQVVALPGSKEARDYVTNHQLLHPDAVRDLKAHVVVTGYNTARTTISFLRKYEWECLIVDEGQALKNDKSDLFKDLCTLNVHHRLILTGTPLQNNIRELFNIMQFLDPSQFHAAELEEKYEELDEERVREIHTMLRPRFLRRTKADVLSFLPPKSEIIVPLSMSSVQKELYKSIVSQNPDLMKAITLRAQKGAESTKAAVPKLNNILMQLRKCLAHPFIQSPALEDRTVDAEQAQRALIEGSGKLTFLAKILPKLKERGHRVLIFSQFLDMLDLLEEFLPNIGFRTGRLDGQTDTTYRQHLIDEFNAPDSELDCFLLSTRAGGAGINLATADTVIVYDPDFNPHQDLQALARAHRIGQEKKVLVYRLMTRNTKIYQTSKKKMVLDHLIVESLDNNEEKLDVQALLLHGLKALFEDTAEKDIKYDDNDIEKLLDRSQIEETVEEGPSEEKALGSFKTARIWANSTAQLEDLSEDTGDDVLEEGYWDKIIQERKSLAMAQKLAAAEEAGRGKRRAAKKVDYTAFNSDPIVMSDPIAMPSDQSDDEFAVPEEASEDENTDEDDWMLSPDENDIDLPEVGMDVPVPAAEKPASTSEAKPTIQSESAPKWGPRTDPAFLAYLKAAMRKPVSMVQTSNASLADPKPPSLPPPSVQHPPAAAKAKPKTSVDPTPAIRKPIQTTVIPSGARDTSRLQEIRSIAPEPPTDSEIACLICSNRHVPGHCPLREIQPQQCPLCGFHHIHHRRTCPLLADLDAVKEIQKKLKESTEDRAVLDAAVTFIRGVKGGLDRKKKKEST